MANKLVQGDKLRAGETLHLQQDIFGRLLMDSGELGGQVRCSLVKSEREHREDVLCQGNGPSASEAKDGAQHSESDRRRQVL